MNGVAMIDIRSLASEIAADPSALGYAQHVAEGSDHLVASLLNESRFPGVRPVTIAEVEGLSIRRGVTPKLFMAADSTPTNQAEATAKAVAKTALSLFGSSRLQEIHVDDQQTSNLLDALVSAGVITADDRSAVIALGSTTVSRAEQLFGIGASVTAEDVAMALGRPGKG
jgi:hypothetical protein